MSNQVEQIRAEIERLIKHNAEHPKDEITADVYEYALQDVLEILDKYDQLPAQPVPSDVQETEIRRINITPNEVRYVIDAIPSYAWIFMDEDDAKKGLAIFKAGMLAERERLMKEAPAADVVEMHGSTDAEYPLVLTLGFLKMPRFEFSGKPVRVIIEEIK